MMWSAVNTVFTGGFTGGRSACPSITAVHPAVYPLVPNGYDRSCFQAGPVQREQMTASVEENGSSSGEREATYYCASLPRLQPSQCDLYMQHFGATGA